MKNDLLLFFSKFKAFYNSAFKKACEKYKLSQIEIDIILFLHNNPEYNTATDICNMRGLAKSNVSIALKQLEYEKIIYIKKDEKNKKIRRLYLNNEYSSVYEELADIQKKCFAVIFKDITPEEIVSQKIFLRKCDKNITDYTE